MASISGNLCEHATLSGTTVDTLTLSGPMTRCTVNNKAAAGGADIYFTYSCTSTAPAAPTASGDDTYWVPPGGWKSFDVLGGGGVIVKIIGNGNAYSVEGEQKGQS